MTPGELRAAADRANWDGYESYADRARTIGVLSDAARRLADVIEYASDLHSGTCHDILRLARGETTNHDDRRER